MGLGTFRFGLLSKNEGECYFMLGLAIWQLDNYDVFSISEMT